VYQAHYKEAYDETHKSDSNTTTTMAALEEEIARLQADNDKLFVSYGNN
jgi:hypothetical protein